MLNLLAAAAFSIPALAPQTEHSSHHGAAQIAQAAALTEGEVRKVDKDAQKITIKHGPLENLDMPAMTMVFQVKDPGMLEQVKAGDKVKFQAEKVGGAYTVTKIEPVR
jgi:Cu(I)/Ag(I) efflux system protein CusF